MSASSGVINPQKITEIAQCWKGVHLSSHDSVKPGKVHSADASSSSDELNTKVRKPYTITKQRERWTETEHEKFLEALKLHGRGWRRIEEYIGTKTAVQIRSHAQKFFSKLEREASTGSSGGKLPDIAIPPPRPKRKPSHPYPKKAGGSLSALEDDSKEAMLSSSACGGAAHAEHFQIGVLGSGLGGHDAGWVAENPMVHGQRFDRQGSVKIFGKAVSIGKVDEGVFYGYAKSIGLVRNDNCVPAKQNSAPEPIENMEFSSSVEVRNTVDSFSQTATQLDRNVSQRVATQPEGTGESFVGACGNDLREADVDVGVSVNCSREECKVSDDGIQAKHESSSLAAAGLKEDEKQNLQLSHVLSPVITDWMNNVLCHQNTNPIPPDSTSGVIDGHPGNSLNYWQFIQASAMNYAVYTAAMAAAAVAGWKAPDSREADKTTVNELQLQALSTLPWWPYGRFMPPIYVPHPQDAVQQVEVKAARALGHVKEVSEEFHVQGEEPDASLKGTDILDTCETPLEAGYKGNERMMDRPVTTNPSTQMRMLETTCLTRASATILPDSHTQLHATAIAMPAKLFEQSSDTEKRDVSSSPQNLYISSDDFEEQSKKQREGSSSGSNTPVPVSQSSESKKKNHNNTSEDVDDGSSDSLQISTQQCVAITAELLNQRVKHAEKGRKHQQRDARHGWGGDPKRFKSCLHEMEVRKEVSQEGRKAFQALFASKSLPQTFPAAVDRELMAEDKRVSDRTMSRDEARATTGSRCIKFDATPGEDPSQKAKRTDNASSSEVCNDVQMSDAQPLSAKSSKGFTVSSSSGFVPYRKKLWLEPSQVAK